MIGCTKLLCGKATVSEVLRYSGVDPRDVPAKMLQFSTKNSPLVVWNTTRRCNLRCAHCYISAEDREFSGELTTEEARAMIADLADMKVPVLMFSGGEPLLRKDFYELGKYATDIGIRAVVSTNGTLIDKEAAERIVASGFKYVGVSLDGLKSTHDRFRGVKGAYERAIKGLENCLDAGTKPGARFTLTKWNYNDLPGLVDEVIDRGIPRFCMYHLVYSGRGEEIAGIDTTLQQKREAIDYMISKSFELADAGIDMELLTVDNHADGVYILKYIEKNQPERYEEAKKLLLARGGCSAGDKFSNVDPSGEVHLCQFWGHLSLGNVKDRKFSDIWLDENNELLKKMRNKPAYLKGKCGECSYAGLCAGCRIRAEHATGDIWEEDPACYLDREEVVLKEPLESGGGVCTPSKGR